MAQATHTEVFNCTVEQFFKLVTDYESYPEFLAEAKSAKIIRQEENKKWVEYEVSVIKTIRYTLEMTEEAPHIVRWELTKGDIFKKNTGSWTLSDQAGQCKADYTIELQFGIFVPGPITKTLQTVNLRSMMSSFHKRVQDVYGS